MENKEKIKKLKSKKNVLRSRLFYIDKYNEDGRELAKEYQKVANELKELGVEDRFHSYTSIEYWNNKAKKSNFVSTRTNPSKEDKTKHKETGTGSIKSIIKSAVTEAIKEALGNEGLISDYTFSIARKMKNDGQYIKDYFESIGMDMVVEYTTQDHSSTNWITEYNYSCTKEVFEIIKKTTIYMIGCNDISVFGKKRSY